MRRGFAGFKRKRKSSRRSDPDVAVAGDDVLVGTQVGGAHGSAGVEFIGGNADLGAFRKAGAKAYEVLKIIDAKTAVHKEIGKN